MAKKAPPPGLDDLTGPTTADFRQHHTDEYENQIVQVLCRRYKIPGDTRKQMLDEQKGLVGTALLTLDMWHRYFPGFPMYLGAVIIPHLPKDATVSKLITSFTRRQFMPEYEHLLENIPESAECLPVGLVFRWPFLSGPGSPPTGLVLHNRSPSWDVPGVRIVWISPDSKDRLVIEPLAVVLASIDKAADGRRWSPESEDFNKDV